MFVQLPCFLPASYRERENALVNCITHTLAIAKRENARGHVNVASKHLDRCEAWMRELERHRTYRTP